MDGQGGLVELRGHLLQVSQNGGEILIQCFQGVGNGLRRLAKLQQGRDREEGKQKECDAQNKNTDLQEHGPSPYREYFLSVFLFFLFKSFYPGIDRPFQATFAILESFFATFFQLFNPAFHFPDLFFCRHLHFFQALDG